MIYAFDVDGVLTNTGFNIDPEFEEWFVAWSVDKQYTLITGSTFERTVEQLGSRIVEGAMMVGNCMGNSVYQQGNTVVLNEFEFTPEEQEFLMYQVDVSHFQHKATNHIVKRPGSVNFSVVGRNATIEQRQLYKQFDKEHQERVRIAKEFMQKFPRFEVYIGGDISVDICLAGANKSQFATLFEALPNNKIYFFGDKMDEWGIDRPLGDRIMGDAKGRVFHITNGYSQTKNILMHLLENDIL